MVVTRTRSIAADSDTRPPTVVVEMVSDNDMLPLAAQVKFVASISDIATDPCDTLAAAFLQITNPAVEETATMFEPLFWTDPALRYPDDVTLPDPSWIKIELVPLVETPLKCTLTRLAQAGMTVKSTLVPDVDAVGVPRVSVRPKIVFQLAAVVPDVKIHVNVHVSPADTDVIRFAPDDCTATAPVELLTIV